MSNKDIEVKSEAKTVHNQKEKDNDAMLKKMKEKEKKDIERAKKAREADAKPEVKEKKAEKKTEKKGINLSKKSEDALTDVAVAAGGALLGGLAAKGGKKKALLIVAIIAVVAIGGFFLFKPQIMSVLGFKAPQTLAELKPDDVMGYNKVDFQNAILLESREKQELVVMEQDVEVTSEISHALANISIFKKTKKIHSFGTGVYTVNMSQINEEHIQVDSDKKTVTITIPKAVLQYVQPEIEKTEFEDTKHAILGFGDIKMTQEQQGILAESIDKAMRKELDQDSLYDKANEIALLKVREIFQPLVTEVSDQFIVKVVQ